ncbi:hypothetical protein PAMA_014289 [Pampus argenteus]
MGTPLLMESLLAATTQHLETATPEVPCQVSPTPRRRRPARVVVVGEVRAPRPPPSEWTRVAPGRKANGAPLVLRECFIPLNPVWFSPGVLAAMETPVPSPVDAVSTGSKKFIIPPKRWLNSRVYPYFSASHTQGANHIHHDEVTPEPPRLFADIRCMLKENGVFDVVKLYTQKVCDAPIFPSYAWCSPRKDHAEAENPIWGLLCEFICTRPHMQHCYCSELRGTTPRAKMDEEMSEPFSLDLDIAWNVLTEQPEAMQDMPELAYLRRCSGETSALPFGDENCIQEAVLRCCGLCRDPGGRAVLRCCRRTRLHPGGCAAVGCAGIQEVVLCCAAAGGRDCIQEAVLRCCGLCRDPGGRAVLRCCRRTRLHPGGCAALLWAVPGSRSQVLYNHTPDQRYDNLCVRQSRISVNTREYQIDIIFAQTWVDTRLRYNSSSSMRILTLNSNMVGLIWLPDTIFRNSKNADSHWITTPNQLLRIWNNGKILYTLRCRLWFKKISDQYVKSRRFNAKHVAGALRCFQADEIVYKWRRNSVETSDQKYWRLYQFDFMGLRNTTDVLTTTAVASSSKVPDEESQALFYNLIAYSPKASIMPFSVVTLQ